jgi:uncharacterized protein YceK
MTDDIRNSLPTAFFVVLMNLVSLVGCSTTVSDTDAAMDAPTTERAADVVPDVTLDTAPDRETVDVPMDAPAVEVVATDVPCVGCPAPRPIAPLTTARVTSRRPTLRWALAPGTDGADIELCADRVCTRPLARFTTTGDSVRVPSELPTGVVFWRMRGTRAGVVGSTTSCFAPIRNITGSKRPMLRLPIES